MSYVMPYLTFAGILILVMLPVFLPLAIVAVANLARWRPAARQGTAVPATQRPATQRGRVPSTA